MKNKHFQIYARNKLNSINDHHHRKPRKITTDDIIKGIVKRGMTKEINIVYWKGLNVDIRKLFKLTGKLLLILKELGKAHQEMEQSLKQLHITMQAPKEG